MEQNGNGAGAVATGADLIARGRRRLELPSGLTVVVGRIELDDFVEAVGGLPDVSALALEKGEDAAAKALRRPAAKAVLSGMARVIQRGVIEPELFEKRKDGPTALDFGIEDRAAIYAAVLELSGFTKEEGKKVLPLSKTGA